ncbi:MAG: GFA family protein [Bdellovibrionota bacterium]
MNKSNLKGHCFCNSITYEITPPTKIFSHCHCESCRRSHGSAFVSWTSVESKYFKITSGEELISNYESSPGIIWQFCKKCGNSLFQKTRHSPDMTYIVVASLIDAIDREPQGHVSFAEKVTWLDINDNLPKFKEKASDILVTNTSLNL